MAQSANFPPDEQRAATAHYRAAAHYRSAAYHHHQAAHHYDLGLNEDAWKHANAANGHCELARQLTAAAKDAPRDQ
ncbi:MAG: hypothetical protein P4L72_11640 [Parvibaculum sp.]|jgi:hypothetical protein|uniref:hypothetical protein n=1 Tax=Parvibaculum sp. TaxID=2024848 RepID=UPI002843F638|nr:hypothetical protein [Parvibaculum sp.]MDR3499864.1 hypothetical protein [Parvibaculum sp.]